jgi:hypothetical protein
MVFSLDHPRLMYIRTDLQHVAGICWRNIAAAWCPAARQLPHNAGLVIIIHKKEAHSRELMT